MPEAPAQKIKRQPVERTSAPLLDEQIAKLRQLFPEAVSEGKIDFNKLRATLGDAVETRPERFSFTWAGKQDAIALLQTPSRATLIPCPEESVNFDTTQHLFIEGDNLEVLKLLFKPYFGRVKMIYIDPPYNTGQDFIYPDNYADPLATYLQLTGQMDSAGNLLTSNPETSGRYHSSWLSMMYPRLFLARQLLSEDGVVFVSIDDHEVHHLRLLMNEVFGEENFVCTFAWEKRYSPPPDTKEVGYVHESIIFYRRDDRYKMGLLPLTQEQKNRYRNLDHDPRGPWKPMDYTCRYTAEERPNLFYPILHPITGKEVWPKRTRVWAFSREVHERYVSENRVWWGEAGKANVPALKNFLSEIKQGMMPKSLLPYGEVGSTDEATKELRELLPEVKMTPKPTRLIKHLSYLANVQSACDQIIVDFFAGSCTTAQGVLEMNSQDGGNRRFIMVQLPEPTRSDPYPTIAEIGKQRIRRVIAKLERQAAESLKDPTAPPQDLGFKVFKLAASNYEPWTGVPERDAEAYIEQMSLFTDPLVKDWQPVNVIWEVAIKEGYGLNARIEKVEAAELANVVYRVTDPDKGQSFRICLDDAIKPGLDAALKLGAEDLFICRDKALDDSAAANLALQCRLKVI